MDRSREGGGVQHGSCYGARQRQRCSNAEPQQPGAAPIPRDLAQEREGGGGSGAGGTGSCDSLGPRGGAAPANISHPPLPWACRCVGSKPEVASSCSPSQEAGHGVSSGVGGGGRLRQLAEGREACWASMVSPPRVPRWCSSSVAGCLGHQIQTPGLSPWQGRGFRVQHGKHTCRDGSAGWWGAWCSPGEELPLPWRPAKGGLKIPPVGEAAVSPGRAATVAVGIVHTASPC